MSALYDFVAVGDATIDVVMQLDEANVMCELDSQNCKLCLNYADKIAVEHVAFVVAGNAANAAVAARRLGATSAFLSTVGEDETGKKIVATFQKEGVSTEYLTVDGSTPSNYSVVLDFQGERTILVHHEKREYVWKLTTPPKWFYLTSMGEGFEPIYDKVVSMVQQGNVYLAYNPGTHQLKKGLDYLKSSIAASTIFFLNREEGARLLGLADHTPLPELMPALKALGPQIVVITDGPNGAYVFDGQTLYQLGIYDGPVVDRTGSGDSFATAFTMALAESKTIPEAMQWGTANATSVVGQIGPQAGLLTQDGIMQIIAQNPDVQPLLLFEANSVNAK